jgi:hypothetical protein
MTVKINSFLMVNFCAKLLGYELVTDAQLTLVGSSLPSVLTHVYRYLMPLQVFSLHEKRRTDGATIKDKTIFNCI